MNAIDKQTPPGFDNNRLSHAYITDPSFADHLAAAVVCSSDNNNKPCMSCKHCDKASRNIHPDIINIDKEKILLIDKESGKEKVNIFVNVDVVRWIKKDVFFIPNDSAKKAYIVRDADSMNINAQNAFLQILEEPPPHAVFILCSDNPTVFLPTVRSRCVNLKSRQNTDQEWIPETDSETEELVDVFLSAIGRDNLLLMNCMFQIEKLDKIAFAGFLELAREQIALSLRKPSETSHKFLLDTEKIFSKAEEMLDLNVSIGHISAMICASMINMN